MRTKVRTILGLSRPKRKLIGNPKVKCVMCRDTVLKRSPRQVLCGKKECKKKYKVIKEQERHAAKTTAK